MLDDKFKIGTYVDILYSNNKWYKGQIKRIYNNELLIHTCYHSNIADTWFPISSDKIKAYQTHTTDETGMVFFFAWSVVSGNHHFFSTQIFFFNCASMV